MSPTLTAAELITRLQHDDATFMPYRTCIRREQIAAYERALDLPPRTDRPVPEPLLVAASIAAFDAAFGRVPGTLHTGQVLRVVQLPRAGEELIITGSIGGGAASRHGYRFTIDLRGRGLDDETRFESSMIGMVLTEKVR